MSVLRAVTVSMAMATAMLVTSMSASAAEPAPYVDTAHTTFERGTSWSLALNQGLVLADPFVAEASGSLTEIRMAFDENHDGAANTEVTLSVSDDSARPQIGNVLGSQTVTVSGSDMTFDFTAADVELVAGETYVLSVEGVSLYSQLVLSAADGSGDDDFAIYDPNTSSWNTYGNFPTLRTTLTVEGMDADAPIIDATTTPPSPDGDNGWFVTHPTVAYTCTDPTTRVVSCPGAEELPDGEHALVRTATDLAGNDGQTTVQAMVDTRAPSVSVSPDREPNAYGWYRRPVSLTYQCSDATSGVSACPDSRVVDRTMRVRVEATDNAGNVRQRSWFGEVDQRDPEVWIGGVLKQHEGRPDVRCRADDGAGRSASGVAECYVEITRVSRRLYEVTATASDRAGNRSVVRATVNSNAN